MGRQRRHGGQAAGPGPHPGLIELGVGELLVAPAPHEEGANAVQGVGRISIDRLQPALHRHQLQRCPPLDQFAKQIGQQHRLGVLQVHVAAHRFRRPGQSRNRIGHVVHRHQIQLPGQIGRYTQS